MSCYNSQLGKLGRFSQPDRQSGGQHTWHVNGMSKFTSDMSFTLLCVTSQIITIQADHLYCSVPLSAAAIGPRTHALTSANNTAATNNNQTATNIFNTTRQRKLCLVLRME